MLKIDEIGRPVGFLINSNLSGQTFGLSLTISTIRYASSVLCELVFCFRFFCLCAKIFSCKPITALDKVEEVYWRNRQILGKTRYCLLSR